MSVAEAALVHLESRLRCTSTGRKAPHNPEIGGSSPSRGDWLTTYTCSRVNRVGYDTSDKPTIWTADSNVSSHCRMRNMAPSSDFRSAPVIRTLKTVRSSQTPLHRSHTGMTAASHLRSFSVAALQRGHFIRFSVRAPASACSDCRELASLFPEERPRPISTAFSAIASLNSGFQGLTQPELLYGDAVARSRRLR